MSETGKNLPPAPGSSEEAAFVAVAPLYDRLMDGVPYDSWTRYLETLFAKHHAQPKRILDVACGTGNVTECLAEQGYRMTGVDIAADMIAEAQRKAAEKRLDIAYFVQDAAELSLPDAPFDLALSLFDSLNYIVDPERLQMALIRIGAHLPPDALFIFDLNSEFALENNFFDQDNLTSTDRLRYDWRSQYFPQTRLCRVQMRFWYREDDGSERPFEEVHWQFAYREDEIREMLAKAGFADVTTYQAYTQRPVSPTSDRIFYVARKNAAPEKGP